MPVGAEPHSWQGRHSPVAKACAVTVLTSGLLTLGLYLGGEPYEPSGVATKIGIAMWALAPPILGGFLGGFLGVRTWRLLPALVLSRVTTDALIVALFSGAESFRLGTIIGLTLLSMILGFPLGGAGVAAGLRLARRRGIPVSGTPGDRGRRGFTTGSRWADALILVVLATVIAMALLALLGMCIGEVICS